ncbi:expressed unknown protein [Ectocarpus siliculosus]|uniref:R3H domain-containing protein n=1 Tax=Ectocarpus siliculosus TaxID=2880 RepID=D7FP96_ECTSI|nr:expressed unknown protein [Ectocarpus siliculosus]|eukprot:CBJ30357.1 expressed unknown protein [Ectocarpus siliculosus]
MTRALFLPFELPCPHTDSTSTCSTGRINSAMYAPAFGTSPPREEAPVLIARHYETRDDRQRSPSHGGAVESVHHHPDGRTGHDDEDDSLAVVFSADTGAGRAHTPQRLNRTHTPQRLRPSSILHTAAAPVQQSSATRREGESRRQPAGRRKQRRWENDNLLGVEKFLRGRHAHEEGEAEHLTVKHTWRSSLGDLVSDPRAAEVRESFRNGMQPTPQKGGSAPGSGARHFTGGKWEDAEERFLLVERRLRDIVVRALRNPALVGFLEGLETLLGEFTQTKQILTEMPSALRSALASPPKVEVRKEAGKSAGKSAEAGAGPTLLVPLGPSPFHRLLLHALCQYQKLRSKSEETKRGRIVRVMIPTSTSTSTSASTSGTAFAAPNAPLTEFVLRTRLQDYDRLREREGAARGEGRLSQASPSSAGAGCSSRGERARAITPTTVATVA